MLGGKNLRFSVGSQIRKLALSSVHLRLGSHKRGLWCGLGQIRLMSDTLQIVEPLVFTYLYKQFTSKRLLFSFDGSQSYKASLLTFWYTYLYSHRIDVSWKSSSKIWQSNNDQLIPEHDTVLEIYINGHDYESEGSILIQCILFIRNPGMENGIRSPAQPFSFPSWWMWSLKYITEAFREAQTFCVPSYG